MSRNLPPLAALRAFEAAARHLSFTKAAAELGMTQAAVSYQIK
ncbi:LysR family transcriptional regulator, partial [Aureimonas ureilytica]